MNSTSNDYYKVGGSLEPNAPSYGVRQADEDFYQALKAGEFCYVLNSRQMGKSSLRVRTVGRLEAEGIACSQIDITSIGSRGITASEWYWGVVRRLARSFKTSVDLKTWWQERAEASPVDRLSQFIEEVLLVEVRSSIAIFIDEIDSILNLDFKDDFFALIRTCYNQRAENPEYRRLTFALLGVATPSDLIQDKSRTPFNIGRSIDLRGLQLHEAEPLAQGLQGKAEDAIAVLKSILDWTGGQPFLTQKICQFVQSEADWIPAGQEAERVRSLVQSRVIENWEGQDEPEHLRTIQNRVTREDERKGQLLGLYQQVLEKGAIPATESEEQIRLRLSGLVVKDQGQLKPHNRIYAAVFDRAWAEQILAELRPYAEAIAIWLKSEGQDESRLLRGNALEEAQRWAADKHLGEQDVRFLSASEQAEKRVMMEEKRILTEANRRAARRLKMTAGLLGLAVVMAGGSGLWASNASVNAKRAEQEQRSAEAKTQVANAAANAAQNKEQIANKSLETVKVELVSTKELAKSAKEQEQQAKSKLQTAKQEQQNAESELKDASQQLQTANQNVATAKQELATVKERFESANQKVMEAEEKVTKAERQQRNAEKRVAEAISKLKPIEKALKRRQDEIADVWEFSRGESAVTLGKPEEAMKIFDQILKRNPQNSFVRIGRARIYSTQKDYLAAEKELMQVLEFDHENALAHFYLGTVLALQEKYDEAIKTLEKAIQLGSKDDATYFVLGSLLARVEKYDEAIKTLEKAIQLGSKDDSAFFYLGIALLHESEYDKATKAFEGAAQLNSQNPDVYNALAVLLARQGKHNEAITAAQRAVRLAPKDAKYRSTLGTQLFLKKRDDEAIVELREALQLNSEDSQDYQILGALLTKRRDFGEASRVLRRGIQLNSSDALSRANLGKVYHLQGRNPEALEQLDRAIELDPTLKWAIELRDKIQKIAP
ncbi:tetratricopeptide repeat protein [Leptolyngbya boryana CZ1]|uniref:Tetratricopeptide repeat protein n=1 Tax=Leptolyngbya boryana CZ1 TaxID=3060204 RepID=A0AA96X0K5_LEPBY|nr:tetratricopeptide repeat protein [Leptolyngbya boryana]WNZ49140.1 tetratricopeptide repeat protein [Leptolyngbya boryana CZ1]